MKYSGVDHILLQVAALILCSGSCSQRKSSTIGVSRVEQDYFTSDSRRILPGSAASWVKSLTPEEDIIRSFWFHYSYGNVAGIRVWLQLNYRTWLETWAVNRATTFLIEGRSAIQNQPGTLVLRLPDDQGKVHRQEDSQFEVFIPDSTNRPNVALFRVNRSGVSGAWQTLGAVNVIK